jgi:hypothetical protein
MRIAAPFAAIVMAAALLGGCGSSSEETTQTGKTAPSKARDALAPVGATAQACALDTGEVTALRVTGVSCGEAERTALQWRASASCSARAAASRSACSAGLYRCLGARTDRGVAVSCARPGQAVSFRVRG